MNFLRQKSKNMGKKIGIGCAIILPLIILLSIFFVEINMDSTLSIFLTVLACGTVCFVYILIFDKVQQNKIKHREKHDDPFSH